MCNLHVRTIHVKHPKVRCRRARRRDRPGPSVRRPARVGRGAGASRAVQGGQRGAVSGCGFSSQNISTFILI